MVPESACIPVPSELTLLSAGFGVHQGWFSFPVVVAAATAGNLTGSLMAYGLGRSGVLLRLPGRRGVALAGCERLFWRRGLGTVFIARLLPLARTFVSLPAGHVGVPFIRFTLLTIAGCVIWSAARTRRCAGRHRLGPRCDNRTASGSRVARARPGRVRNRAPPPGEARESIGTTAC